MKLLFVHDVKAFEFNGEYYARSYGYNIFFERYLNVFDSITVCCRVIHALESPEGKINKSTGSNVTFENRIRNFKGPDVFLDKKIKKILTQNIKNADAVIVRLDSFLGLQTIRICKKLKKKYLIEVVGCVWDSFWNHGIFGKILAPYLFFRTRNEIRTANAVIYVTSSFLQHRYPTNGLNTNVSNVDLKYVDEIIAQKKESQLRAVGKNKIVLGTAANVDVRYKGQQFVIRALALLKKQGKNSFVYQIAGAGDQTYLKRQIKKYNLENEVFLIGSMPHKKLMDWLENDVNIYIQPSLQEGLPRSVIEAMSFGIPCLGSSIAGIPELLESNCLFSTKGNVAKNIAQLLMNMSVEDLCEQGIRNFSKSKEYLFNVLNARRESFFRNYFQMDGGKYYEN